MSSDLDLRRRAITARLTAPGTPFELTRVVRGGRMLPAYRHAPAHLPALFDSFCAKHRKLEFLVDGEIRLTFAQTHALARRVAATLIAEHGLRPGDRVGIAGHNSANWIVAYMGVLMAGGCATLVNGWWQGEEIAGGLALADCTLLLADPLRIDRLQGRRIAAKVIAFDHGAPEQGLAGLLGEAQAALPEMTSDDIATIVFTSGSTGTAKGAVSDHFALAQAAVSFAVHSIAGFEQITNAPSAAGLPSQPATLLSMPLFHVAGEVALLLQSFVLGRKLVLMPRWDAVEAMRLIERERVTSFLGAPLMASELTSRPERADYDLSSCMVIGAGGAPAPADFAQGVRSGLRGTVAMQGYALTETNSVGCSHLAESYLAKPGSVGPAGSPTVEVAVFGADGFELPHGMRGEIAIRSVCNFSGYWRNREETGAAVRPDGFFLTGDLGYLDEDGYLFVVDRKKDLIIRGGENISPIEVEQRLYTHPAVAEVSVFGVPDRRYGEVPVAVFAPHGRHAPAEDELRAHVAAGLAAFKVPVRVWRESGALPRLGSGKIDKMSLKARYSQEWEAAKAAS